MENHTAKLDVSLIPPQAITMVWTKVAPHLKRATDISEGRYDIVDVFGKLTSGEHNLWVIHDGEDIIAAITSTFTEYPQCKALHGQFLGGDRLDEWQDKFCEVFDRWGRDNACQKVEFSGRWGWKKKLERNGYKPIFVIYERNLE